MRWLAALAFTGALAVSLPVSAQLAVTQPVSGPQLLQLLRSGGYVLVMRHADSPLTLPSAHDAAPDNPQHERQLSAAGESSARAIGAALRAQHIPVGPIFSSPTYRARETIRLAALGEPILVPALAEGDRGMSGAAEQSRADWLREAVRRPPPAGMNTLIVTHTPNIASAFGRAVADIKAAEILVVSPNPGHAATLIARMGTADWPKLAR
jgi:phosphohistidine phosphatase SixA